MESKCASLQAIWNAIFDLTISKSSWRYTKSSFGSPNSESRRQRFREDHDMGQAKTGGRGTLGDLDIGWSTSTKPKPCQTWSKASIHMPLVPREGGLAQMEAMGVGRPPWCRLTWKLCQLGPFCFGGYLPTFPSQLWPGGGLGGLGGNFNLTPTPSWSSPYSTLIRVATTPPSTINRPSPSLVKTHHKEAINLHYTFKM
jgi:hypothetical protein